MNTSRVQVPVFGEERQVNVWISHKQDSEVCMVSLKRKCVYNCYQQSK